MRLEKPSNRSGGPGFIGALIALILVFAWNGDVGSAQAGQAVYTLGSGDQLRVTVFDEKDLSGEFEVDGSGHVSLPLIGEVSVGGLSPREVERKIEEKLKLGFLKRPRVSVEILNYRPFYILGEVKKPGSYNYVSGMTVLNAVAMAEGYTYRANKKKIRIIRASDPSQEEQKAAPDTVVLPGDIIRVKERFF